LDTLAAVIVESGATLVLARSPFGYAQDPDGAAAPENAVLAGFVLAGFELLLHAAASRATETSAVTGTSRLAPARTCLVPIRFTAF
jgi:hypothetical protein